MSYEFGVVKVGTGLLDRSYWGYVTFSGRSVLVYEPSSDVPVRVQVFTPTGVVIAQATLEDIWDQSGDPDEPALDLAGDVYIRTYETPRTVELPEGWHWEETPETGPQWFFVGPGGLTEFDFVSIWSNE